MDTASIGQPSVDGRDSDDAIATAPCELRSMTDLAFGAVVEARVGGERYRVRADEHAGACGRPLSETTATVRGKFEREVGAEFDRVRETHERGLSALTRLLSTGP